MPGGGRYKTKAGGCTHGSSSRSNSVSGHDNSDSGDNGGSSSSDDKGFNYSIPSTSQRVVNILIYSPFSLYYL